MGTLKTTNIQTITGSGTLTLGTSGETVSLGSGVTVSGNGLVGITMADQWRLTANVSADVDPIASNLERVDEPGWGGIGTGMTESSGEFTFPTTGIYLILVKTNIFVSLDSNVGLYVYVDSGSGYDFVEDIAGGNSAGTGRSSNFGSIMVDVTNTSDFKVKFRATGLNNTNQLILGNTDYNRTTFTFIRLGDT